MIIMTNGTLLAIQNMTWNGALGFQSTPNTSFIVELPELQNADVFTMQNNAPAEGAQGVMGVTVSVQIGTPIHVPHHMSHTTFPTPHSPSFTSHLSLSPTPFRSLLRLAVLSYPAIIYVC